MSNDLSRPLTAEEVSTIANFAANKWNAVELAMYVLSLRASPPPAPPPSPSKESKACEWCAANPGAEGVCEYCDENAGEGASDEELKRVEDEARERVRRKLPPGPPPLPDHTWRREERRALYDLGKKHQASADAATVAGLRQILRKHAILAETVRRFTEQRRRDQGDASIPWRSVVEKELFDDLWAVDHAGDNLRPEPGGGK